MLRKWATKFSCPFRSWLVSNMYTEWPAEQASMRSLLSPSRTFKTLWVYLLIQSPTFCLCPAPKSPCNSLWAGKCGRNPKEEEGAKSVKISVTMKFKEITEKDYSYNFFPGKDATQRIANGPEYDWLKGITKGRQLHSDIWWWSTDREGRFAQFV